MFASANGILVHVNDGRTLKFAGKERSAVVEGSA
jgi:hypothetical protein